LFVIWKVKGVNELGREVELVDMRVSKMEFTAYAMAMYAES